MSFKTQAEMKSKIFHLGKGYVEIGLKYDWAIQLSFPRCFRSSYGYGISARTVIVVGKRAFAINILGFGIGIAKSEFNTLARGSK